MIDENLISKYQKIGKEFSKFFKRKHFTSSYKPILFQSILINIKKDKIPEQNISEFYLISIDDIVIDFLKFNYILYNKFKLKQLKRSGQQVKIYSIIDEHLSGLKKKKLENGDITIEAVDKVKKLLFRHVIFLLRKDMHIYDFYDRNKQLIRLPVRIKDEQEFKSLINPNNIEYIGLANFSYDYIYKYRFILEKANLGVCTEFLEGFNTVPKLFTKLMVAAQTFQGKRNVKKRLKDKLYEYQNYHCFYCGEDIKDKAHADHFVPYDYLFDSPIWNIVGSCPECNLRKSDKLVNSDYLERLKERNRNPNFQQVFRDSLDKYLGGNIELINKELEQHYNNCSIYFDFIPNFRKNY